MPASQALAIKRATLIFNFITALHWVSPIGVNHIPTSTDAVYGQIILTNLAGNIWTASGGVIQSGYNVNCSISGAKTLSASLDRIWLATMNGTVNIIYKG